MSAARASTSHRTVTPNSDGASGMRIANAYDELLARVEGPLGKFKGEAPDVMSVQLLASLLSEMSDSPPFPSSPLPSPRSPSALHSLHPVASPRRAVLPPERAHHAKCAARCEDGNIAPDAAVASSGVPSGMRMGARCSEVAPAADARLRGADARDFPLARALAELEAQDRAREMATAATRRAAPRNARDSERAHTGDGEARVVGTTGSDSSAHNMSETSAEARHSNQARGDGGIEDIIAHLPRSNSASLAYETQEIPRRIDSRRGESDGCAFSPRSGTLVGRGARATRADGASGSSSSSSLDGSAARFSAFEASREAMVRALTAHLRRPSAEPASPHGPSTSGALSEPVHARSMTASGGRSAIRPRTSGGERGERAIAGGDGWGGAAEGRTWGSRAERVRRRLVGSAGEQGATVGSRETAGGAGVVTQGGGGMGQWSYPGVWNSGAVAGAVGGGGTGGAEAGGMVGGGGRSGVAERWQAGSAQQRMGPPAPRVAGGWSGAAAFRAPPTAAAAAAAASAAAAACAGDAGTSSGAGGGVAGGWAGVADGSEAAGARPDGPGPTGWSTHAALPPASASWPPPIPRLPHMPLFPHSASMPLPPHSAPLPLLPHSAPIPLTPHSPPPFLPHAQPIPLRPHSAPATAFPHSASAPRVPHAQGTPNSRSATPLPGQHPASTTSLAPAISPLSLANNSFVAHRRPFAPSLQGAWHVGAAAAEGTAAGAAAGAEGAAAAGAAATGGMGVEEEMMWGEFDAMLMGAPAMHAHSTVVNPMAAHFMHAHGTGGDPMGAHFMTARTTGGDPMGVVGPSGGHPMGAAWSGAMVHVGVMGPVQAHLPLAAHGTGGHSLAELHTVPVPSGSGGSAEGEAGAEAEVGAEAEAEGGIETGDMAGMEVLGEGGGGTGGSGSSGGRGKNKSVVEKERRERIRYAPHQMHLRFPQPPFLPPFLHPLDPYPHPVNPLPAPCLHRALVSASASCLTQELQRLRQAVRGRGDMAAMLDGAVAYVGQLRAQHRQLEASLLQHQLTCTCPQCHQLGQP
ncbi:unnamed protein product [Closterium sp. Naga37s-1]|nr:unnamed protein product [Closterium sp. Naga37s-1]